MQSFRKRLSSALSDLAFVWPCGHYCAWWGRMGWAGGSKGDLSVEKQLTLICMDRGWDMTVLAQDGSMLEDVKERQVPLIPEGAPPNSTHRDSSTRLALEQDCMDWQA